MILDLDKDKKGGRYKTHTRSVKVLKEFIAKLDVIDAWRVLNPNTLRYTWSRKKPEIQCRLDFFLGSQSLMCNVTHADITMGLKTDHSLITISAALHSNQRSPGYWKLNTSFLSDVNYVNQIRTTIKVIPQYCIAHIYCARFSRHQRAHMSAYSCKTWRICLDIELCQLKNGYSAPTSMGTPTLFLVIVINLL